MALGGVEELAVFLDIKMVGMVTVSRNVCWDRPLEIAESAACELALLWRTELVVSGTKAASRSK